MSIDPTRMSIDPRGPVLPIVCCIAVVIFLMVVKDAAPASVPVMQAVQAAPLAARSDSPMKNDSGVAINFTGSVPDSLVASSNVVPETVTEEVVSRSPDVPVRGTSVTTVKNRPPLALQLSAAPEASKQSPRVSARPNDPNKIVPISDNRNRLAVSAVSAVSDNAPRSEVTPAAVVPAASETRKVLVPENLPAPSPSSAPSRPSEPAPAALRSALKNMNWRIISGEVVGQSRNGARSSDGDPTMENLKSGSAIADGSFRVPGDAVVSPGFDAGRVRFHGATGRLGGEEAGYWISLLSGTLAWEECDGGTIICAGMRLRGNAQARFSVAMDATEIRITVISGRVRVMGAAEPITLNPHESIVIGRDGEIRKASAERAAATGEIR